MPGIDALVARIERFAAAEVKDIVLKSAATSAHAECIRGFNEQRDPYGKRWERRKDGKGSWPVLQKTDAGLLSLQSIAGSGRAVLSINGYFKYHQTGTRSMPARKIYPDTDAGLGLWLEPVKEAAMAAIRELGK